MHWRSLAYVSLSFWLLVALALAAGPAAAQEVEALRREVEQLRKQLQAVTERLQAIESRPQPATGTSVAQPAGPPPAAPPGAGPLSQAPVSEPPTLMELARPRQPFALYERRGTGQLLFDIGVSADFTGSLTQRNVDKADAGSFPGRENRFFPRELEINLFGQIDPYASGVLRVEAGEEDSGEIAVHLAEGYLTLLTLPWGTQVKLGQVRNRFGLLNEHHRDGLPQPDVPNVLLRFLGEEGLVERGAELTWVAPLPFFLEALMGVFNGDNETAFGRGKLSEPLVTGRLRTFFDLEEWGAIQLGMSAANGSTPDRRRNTLVGFDVKYKLRPDGWQWPLFTVGGEAIYQNRRVNVLGVDVDGDGAQDTPDETRIRERWGWYAWAEVQPWKRWAFGARYDWTEYPTTRGHEWAVEPYVTFFLSEFLRFRLAYKHTDRDKRDGFTTNEGSARLVDEVLLQATFILGAHPAHPF